MPRITTLWLALTAGVAVLIHTAPDPRELGRAGGDPQAWVGLHGADQAVLTLVGAVGWLLALWLTAALLLSAAAEVPGLLGRLSRPLAVVVAPAALRRSVAVALGVGLAFGGPTGGWAAPADPGSSTAGTTTALSTAPSSPTPTSPTATGPTPSGTTTAAEVDVVLDWPTAPGTGVPPVTTTPPTPSTAQVRVRAGDTLWGIVRDRAPAGATLGQIAQAVEDWYDTNRATIGADPDLIHPGQLLHAPGAAR